MSYPYTVDSFYYVSQSVLMARCELCRATMPAEDVETHECKEEDIDR